MEILVTYICDKCGKRFENCKAIAGHKSWCGLNRKHSKETIEKIKQSKKEYFKYNEHPLFNKNHSLETRAKMSSNHSNVSRERNPNWKGGISSRYTYYHNIAFRKFGSNNCEECGISNEDYYKERRKRRFEMHCTGNPKDYTVMEKENWLCVCHNCHTDLDKRKIKKLTNKHLVIRGNLNERIF